METVTYSYKCPVCYSTARKSTKPLQCGTLSPKQKAEFYPACDKCAREGYKVISYPTIFNATIIEKNGKKWHGTCTESSESSD